MKISRRAVPAGVPSVALADIAFNLILFFIIMAKTQDDSHLRWQPARAPGVASIPDARFSVTVDTNRTVYLNGDQVSIGDLAARLETGLGTTPAGKRYVLLKIDKGTPAGTFEPIIEAVSQAGGDLVHVLEAERGK
jgi:biopolymer transport protein ExbD